MFFPSTPRLSVGQSVILGFAIGICSLLAASAQTVIFTGAGVSGGPRVNGRLGSDVNSQIFNQFVYEDSFRGGASIAFGDLNADGVPDLLTGPGDGGGPRLRVLDGRLLRQNQIVNIADIFVGDPNFRGGISVASADVNADGFADAIIGQNGYVQVLNGERLRFAQYQILFNQPGIVGAVGPETPVASGDLDGDGYADILVGTANGNGPRLRIFRGERARVNQAVLAFDDFVFDAGERSGLHVAAGDINGDGRADGIFSLGVGAGPRVRIMHGGNLSSGQQAIMYDQFVLDPNTRGGVYVGAADIVGPDGKADLLVGAGPQSGGYARVFDGAYAALNQNVDRGTYIPYEQNFTGGIWVAGANLTLPQCSDGIDNDSDGAMDLNDVGCQNDIRRNDESNPRAVCQDGIDNDGDGLVDLNDPGCSSPQDNDESNSTYQCSDRLDNDSDGLIDLNDPDCSGPTDDSEFSGQSIMPIVECVQNNGNGTFTAYFGYQSTFAATTTIPASTTGTTTNTISPSPISQTPVTSFISGRKKGVTRVVFNGQSVNWTIKTPSGQPQTATASVGSPACKVVLPTISCAQPITGGSSSAVTYGFQNTNEFEIAIPVGSQNGFSPGALDRGQTVVFVSGTVPTAFEVTSVATGTTWTLGSSTAQVTTQSPTCAATCSNTVNKNVKAQLDQVALQLASLTVTAADNLKRVVRTRQVMLDAERAKKRAAQFVIDANSLTIKIPDISQTCADAPPQCLQADNGPTLDALKKLYASQRGAVQRFVARANFRESGATIRNKPLVLSAKAAEKLGSDALAKTPRLQVDCTSS